ncbi:phage tail assembly protein [Marinobacterium jannaschii]|uniref:phage tail assembly protein n=1 Tax=Marinobacterium jannaschii TaxID=64970 RepID=UPI0006863B40|nr:phage tail assembly protein [Marinobacterium jannaschii]
MSDIKTRWIEPVIALLVELVRTSTETVKSLVLVNMLTHEQHVALIDEFASDADGNRKLYRELIKAAFGLDEVEVKKMAVPDYNSLLEKVEEVFGKDSFYWFEKLGVKVAVDNVGVLPLLVPLKTSGGLVDQIELQYPSVEAVDMMHAHPSEKQQAFILSSCTGLAPEELRQLSPPDWRSLDKRVTDFLYQTGSYFSPATISKS